MLIKIVILSVIIAAATTANTAFADDQDITLSSDSAKCTRQNATDICAYSGNAKFIQGETKLTAQQIAIYKSLDSETSSKINKIVASGKHSHYSVSNTKPISADADLITIYPEEHKMNLKGNGVIVSGQDKYSGPDVDYQFE